MTLRPSRNIEWSLYLFISENLTSDWNNVKVVKGFKDAYKTTLPVIAIRLGDTNYESVEIGSDDYRREASFYIDIFAKNDGQKLDLKDYIIDLLKGGCPYYEMDTAVDNSLKTETGRIKIKDIRDTNIKFDVDKSNIVDVHDRYRSQINFKVSIGKVE